MDAGTSSLLESVTLKTLHAQNFSRSSSRASHVLTDLLSRYVSLLASTCARYAEHAGRTTVSVHDAFLALDELGVSVDELAEYADGEAHEFARYATSTARRAEELAVLRENLKEGRRIDQNDGIALVYAETNSPAPSDEESDDSAEEEEKVEVYMNGDVDEDFHMFNGIGPRGTKRVASPTLPLSPVSNQSSPSRKRIRLQRGWDPPSHVPDFLPPFPSSSSELEVNPLQSPQVKTEMEVILPPSSGAYDRERERQPTPPPQHLSMATSAADYLTPVPYNMSSLSSVSEAHLPEPSLRTASTSAGTALQLLPRKRDPPPIVQSIYTAYHHVLTQRPSSEPSTNTGRHRVALTMLDQAYARPRWTAPDTLFANLAASRPRIVSPAPTFPIFLGSALGREDKHLVIPSTLRTLMVDETVFPLSHQPTSRIPNIAQAILPYGVLTRATRLQPPPPLQDPQKKERLLYGSGMPAPWNSNLSASDAGKSGKDGKSSKGADGEGRERDKAPNALEDARLFATWDWETHDPRLPLPPSRRGRATANGVDSHAPGTVGSIVISRKGSRAGREL